MVQDPLNAHMALATFTHQSPSPAISPAHTKNPLWHKASNDINGTQHSDTVQACGSNHRAQNPG